VLRQQTVTLALMEATFSTPLLALDAVVLDTETTGLDPRKARLLQIGAVRLKRKWKRISGSKS
jgi:DNA polymerase-3 subunit epsilon/CBS domain-containing protein